MTLSAATGKESSSVWSLINDHDKIISRPVFQSQLPLWAENALSLPGNWFGLPSVALFLLPNWTALVSEAMVVGVDWPARIASAEGTKQTSSVICTWTLCLVVATFVMTLCWFRLVRSQNFKNKMLIKLFYSSTAGILAPLVGIAMLRASPFSKESVHCGYFQVASWSVAVIPAAILKPLVARTRPAAQMHLHVVKSEDEQPKEDFHRHDGEVRGNTGTVVQNKHHTTPTKHLSILPRLFARDSNASFPSGDTSGAMGLVFILLDYDQGVATSTTIRLGCQLMALSLIVFSCYGRMYWLAHHAIDVMMGAILAYPMCCMLEIMLAWTRVCDNAEHNTALDSDESNSSHCVHHQATHIQAVVVYLILVSIVLVSRGLAGHPLFGSGTIHVSSGSSVDRKRV